MVRIFIDLVRAPAGQHQNSTREGFTLTTSKPVDVNLQLVVFVYFKNMGETNMPRRRGNSAGIFFGGLVTGLVISALAGILVVSVFAGNPRRMAGIADRFGLVQVVEKTVVRTVSRTIHSIPKQQVADRQIRINDSVQKLTSAYAQGKLTIEDVEVLSDRIYQAVADQKVSEKEIDGILDLADDLVR